MTNILSKVLINKFTSILFIILYYYQVVGAQECGLRTDSYHFDLSPLKRYEIKDVLFY